MWTELEWPNTDMARIRDGLCICDMGGTRNICYREREGTTVIMLLFFIWNKVASERE